MPAAPALKRGIRFRDLALFYVVSGLSVRWTATAAAAGPSILIVWIAALTCFFIPLAASVMELSSRHPEEGGLYVWSREAFGDFAGFIAAWTYWMSNLPYFPGVLYFGAASALFAFGPRGRALNGQPAVLCRFCGRVAGHHHAAQHSRSGCRQMAQQRQLSGLLAAALGVARFWPPFRMRALVRPRNSRGLRSAALDAR